MYLFEAPYSFVYFVAGNDEKANKVMEKFKLDMDIFSLISAMEEPHTKAQLAKQASCYHIFKSLQNRKQQ